MIAALPFPERFGMRVSPWLLLFFLLLPFVGAGCQEDSSDPANAPRSTADLKSSSDQAISPLSEPFAVPEGFTVTTTDGATLDIGAKEGRVQVLNFWATWCAPCLEEIPDLNRLHEEYGSQNVQVIGIANKQGPAEVIPFAKRHEIAYPVVADSAGRLDDALGPIYVLPATLIVRPSGRITHQVTGIFPVDTFTEELDSFRG
jgi:thiol-disulfide isomerase/thioredoxin